MCRLLGYWGVPIPLDQLLYAPEHSLVVQSYQPRELEIALLNADGFGVGWYHPDRQTEPFRYRHTLPIWNDVNLPSLARYVESGCFLANIRSATPGLAVDLSNCQPFQQGQLLFTHNGYIERFRATLYRPIRDRIQDTAYQQIHGLTDSEHMFALWVNELEQHPGLSLAEGLQRSLHTLTELAGEYGVRIAANVMVSDGQQLVACRFDNQAVPPSLYVLASASAVIVASEPLFVDQWQSVPPNTLLQITAQGQVQMHALT